MRLRNRLVNLVTDDYMNMKSAENGGDKSNSQSPSFNDLVKDNLNNKQHRD